MDPSRVSIYLDDIDTYRENGDERVAVAHSAERLKPSADDRRPIQPGTQRDEAIPNCFDQTVECDYLSFLRAHEATQVTCPYLLPGVNHPLNVHI